MRDPVVPLVRALPQAGDFGVDVLGQDLVVQLVDADAGLLGNRHEAVDDLGLLGVLDHVAPPIHVVGVELQAEEVVGRRSDVHRRQARNGGLRHVQSHRHAALLSVVADLLGLVDAAGGQDVRVDDGDSSR